MNDNMAIPYKNKHYIKPVNVKEYLFHKHKDGSIHITINNKYYGYTLDDIYARHILVQLSDEYDDCEFCMVLLKDTQDL
jgi:hypothetical protein